MQIKVGDWVTQYSAGIYKVERIIEFIYREPMVVLKKGFTKKLKPSVGWDSCSISLCEKISEELFIEIEVIFVSNSKFNKRFNDYVIPPIQSIYNTQIVLKDAGDIEKIINELNISEEGKTLQQVETFLIENGIKILGSLQTKDSIPFQLICFDYETNSSGDLIYRNAHFI